MDADICLPARSALPLLGYAVVVRRTYPYTSSSQRTRQIETFDLHRPDLHEYLSGPIAIPTTPHALTGAQLPVTLGQEFSGTIEEVGQAVTGLKVGDRVAVRPNLSDGRCASCAEDRTLTYSVLISNSGGLSDYVAVPAKHAIWLSESVPLDLGALVEPLTVAWYAVARSPHETARNALVVGGGPIGLAVVQIPRARGVQTVIVAEVSAQRREYALTLGATHVFNPLADDVVARVRSLTGDAGADISFECSGVQARFDTAMNGIRVRGMTTIVSLWEKKPVIDAFDVDSYEKHVLGAAICEDWDFEAVIGAIEEGQLEPPSHDYQQDPDGGRRGKGLQGARRREG
ncbi:hypothetical protein BDW75DRAFT_236301 [Aspergillus navahoensis]